MKRSIFGFLATVLFVLTLSVSGWSQGATGLKVLVMPGFPIAPQDTAYEGQQYTFTITLVNNSGTVINAPIDVHLKVDSVDSILGTYQAPALGINDTASFTISGYNFTQPQYKVGNNIVVVWPVVNGLALPIDTFFADVFFVPLSSLTDNNLNYNKIALFPNPAQTFLQLKINSNDQVGYVRIYSTDGKLILSQIPFIGNPFDIRDLSKGTYIFEAELNGHIIRRKFIRN
jgi:hypothetical protein